MIEGEGEGARGGGGSMRMAHCGPGVGAEGVGREKGRVERIPKTGCDEEKDGKPGGIFGRLCPCFLDEKKSVIFPRGRGRRGLVNIDVFRPWLVGGHTGRRLQPGETA